MTEIETDQVGQQLQRIATMIGGNGSLLPVVDDAMPDIDVLLHEGVVVCAIYRKGYWNNLRAKLFIRNEDASRLKSIPELPYDDCYVEQIDVVKDNEVAYSVYDGNLASLLRRHARYETDLRKQQTHERFVEDLGVLRARLRVCQRDGLPVSAADELFFEASNLVSRFEWSWRTLSSETVLSKLKAFERELDRLSDIDPTELIVDALMKGDYSVAPSVSQFNRTVIEEIEQFTLRSAEQYGPGVTDLELREFYLERLEGVTSIHELEGLDLKLNPSDYIILDDPDLAPTSVELIGRKGRVEVCEVKYGYYADDCGNKRRFGAIKASYDAFKRCAAEYGKKHSFPEIRHGYDEPEDMCTYRLWMDVKVVDGKYVSGWADDIELINRVEKRKKGLARKPDEFGVEAPTAPPPWAEGQAARGSRRR